MRQKILRRTITLSLLLLLGLGGFACDGGISGTGGPTIIDANGDPTDENDAPEDVDNAPPSEADVQAPVPLINSDATTGQNTALIRFFNFTESTLGSMSLSLDGTPVATPASLSEPVIVPNSTVSIDLFADTEVSVASFDPVALAAGSLTGILVREGLSDDSFDVVTFPGQSTSISDDIVQVRLILISELDSGSGSADTSLVPAGANPAPAGAAFASVAIVAPVGEYLSIAAGDYELQSPLIESMPVTFVPGTSFSILLDPQNQTTPLIILDDSDLN